MKYILLFILLIPLLASCQADKSALSKYPVQVGDIVFDEKLDDKNFKKCNPKESYGYQYYNDSKGFGYKGEKLKIEKELEALQLKSLGKENGYITIRFLVNCEGKTGLFRIEEMNEEYLKTNFDEKFLDALFKFTKNLNGWIPKEIQGKKIDYYQYLTFKIKHGEVSEILP
ncbi:hypothetical protein [Chryseobacterium sp.]|uniref:hypothetical protein n=1 Tax=Chryseobacterium sp. TaxID=1871047 RepID=UPI002FC9C5B8